MSLVNDMLNDLERRSAASKKDSEINQWSVGYAPDPVSKRTNQRIFAYTVLIIVLLIFFAWQYKTISDSDITTTTVFDDPAQHSQYPPPQPIEPVSETAWLTEMAFRQTGQAASLHLGIGPETPYTIRRRAGGLTIELQGVLPKLGDTVIEPVAPVDIFSVHELEGATEVTLNVRGGFHHEVSRLPDGKAQLIISIVPQIVPQIARNTAPVAHSSIVKTNNAKSANSKTVEKNAPANVAQSAGSTVEAGVSEPVETQKNQHKSNRPTMALVKKSVVLSPTQKDEQVAQKAASLIAKGQYAESEKRLKKLLQQQSSAPKSLALYLSLLLSEQRFEQAQRELDKLSSTDAAHPNVMAVQARLYLYRGAPQKSIDLLRSAQPGLHQFPAYYELLAQSAQRAKRYALSEQTYRALLKTDAGRGDWWVGLGVSLDAQGQSNTAAGVYQRALDTGRITPPLKIYAQQRLSALQLSAR